MAHREPTDSEQTNLTRDGARIILPRSEYSSYSTRAERGLQRHLLENRHQHETRAQTDILSLGAAATRCTTMAAARRIWMTQVSISIKGKIVEIAEIVETAEIIRCGASAVAHTLEDEDAAILPIISGAAHELGRGCRGAAGGGGDALPGRMRKFECRHIGRTVRGLPRRRPWREIEQRPRYRLRPG